MNRADLSDGTASVIVAVLGLISVVTSTLLDDYLKRREQREARAERQA